MTVPRSGRLTPVMSVTIAGSIVVLILIGIALSAKAQISKEKPVASQLRDRLRRIADAPDSDLIQQYWELLAESGVKPAIWHGQQLPLAHGYTLLRKDNEHGWQIRSASGQEQRCDDGLFLIAEKGPEPIKADRRSVLLAIDGEIVLAGR